MTMSAKNPVSSHSLILSALVVLASFSLGAGCPCLLPIGGTTTQTGACCATDGTCSVITQAACETAGGTYQGDGTSCTPNPCSAAGPDGTTLYADNCASCHGSDGSNGFAPDVTGDTAAELTTGLASASHGAISLTDAEISAIADFLGS